MTNLHTFLNMVRALYNIDWNKLPELDEQQWPKFRDNPSRYFIHTDFVQQKAIYREVMKRQHNPLVETL